MIDTVTSGQGKLGAAVQSGDVQTREYGPSLSHGVAQGGQVKAVAKGGAKKRTDAPDAHYDADENTTVRQGTDPAGAMAQPDIPSPDNMVLLMSSIIRKFSSEREKGLQSDIKAREADKKAKNDETVEKLKKVIKAQHKAQHSSSIGKVFGWIAVGLMFAVAAIVAVASGGLAAAPLFAAATITLGVMIMQQTGGMEKMEDAMGMNAKQKMIFSIGLAVTMLIINITAAVMSGGAASGGVASSAVDVAAVGAEAGETAAEVGEMGAATAEVATTAAQTGIEATDAGVTAMEESAELVETGETLADTTAELVETGETVADTAGEVTETGETVADTASETTDSMSEMTEQSSEMGRIARFRQLSRAAKIQLVASKAASGANILAGGSTMAQGGASMGAAVYTRQAGEAQADAEELKAEQYLLTSQTDEDIEHLKKTLEKLKEQIQAAAQIVAEGAKTQDSIFDPAANAA